jgi:hypothetical protein
MPGWKYHEEQIMEITSIARFERFFRVAGSVDIDKEDLRHHHEFINRKVHDLLLRGVAAAKASGRDVILPGDLPITKGLQECIHVFRSIDEDIGLRPTLEQLTQLPVLELAYSDDTEAAIPEISGALSVALARSFKIIDPNVKNPMTEHWERSFRVFDLLL